MCVVWPSVDYACLFFLLPTCRSLKWSTKCSVSPFKVGTWSLALYPNATCMDWHHSTNHLSVSLDNMQTYQQWPWVSFAGTFIVTYLCFHLTQSWSMRTTCHWPLFVSMNWILLTALRSVEDGSIFSASTVRAWILNESIGCAEY